MRRRRRLYNRMISVLNGNGYKITEPRRVVMDYLLRCKGHPHAKKIFNAIHRHHPDIGLTSVYRTLDLLTELGLIKRLLFKDGNYRYELKSDESNHHHHLICIKCGKVIEYNDFLEEEVKLFDNMKKKLSEKFDFHITDHEVKFFGICNDCRNNI